MSTMIVEVCEALKAARTPEDKAISAAKAIAENQTASNDDIERLDRRLIRVKMMLAIILTAVVIPLLRGFTH